MELEHRFELPVGIDRAWTTLTDIATVGPCFPGAKLSSVSGDEFSGSVKLKAGPARLTYSGTARFTERDDRSHRATIEATGTEGGSSTATMLVTAAATELSPNRTRVDLITTLSLTGRPASFGRPLMIEAGNRLISQFADCVSGKLVGRPAGGAQLVDVDDPDRTAAAREKAILAPRYALDAAGRYVGGRSAGTPDGATASLTRTLTSVLPVLLIGAGAVLLRKLLQRSPDSGSPTSG